MFLLYVELKPPPHFLAGFPTGVENMVWGLKLIHEGSMGDLKRYQKIPMKEFIYSKAAGYKPANLLKIDFFTYIFQEF